MSTILSPRAAVAQHLGWALDTGRARDLLFAWRPGGIGSVSARLARQVGVVALAAVLLAACATTTSAKDTFGGEPLATQTFPGLEVRSEDWSDGSSGSLGTGKSTPTQLTRTFLAADGASLGDGFAELVAAAASSGWTADEDVSSAEKLVATKRLGPGIAQLLIRSYPHGDLSGDGQPYLLLQLTL
ncbi:MAG: hypothetical protein R2734_06975 [Nocardioides sp.]